MTGFGKHDRKTHRRGRHVVAGIWILLCGTAMGANMDTFQIDLGGPWKAQAIRAASWEAALVPDEGGPWLGVELPAPLWPKDAPPEFNSAPGVWLRRTFQVTPAQAALGAVLHWELIRWGFAATVNGTALGETILYAPGEMALPPNQLKAGENEIVLKVRNWDSLPRGGPNKHPLVPAGAAIHSWGSKNSMVAGEVRLELFDRARIRSVQMQTDFEKKCVVAQVELEAAAESIPPWTQVRVQVYDASGAELGHATASLAEDSGAQPVRSSSCQIAIPLIQFPAWTPEKPQMLRADISLVASDAEGKTFDARSVAFGLRSFEVRGGHFLLNGEPYPLRGSNLVSDWLWSEDRFRNTNDSLKTFLIDTAKGMSVNSFRTHTLPPLHRVADICDQGGMLLLAEMPLTYNGSPTGLDEEQEQQYRENARRMIVSWVRELANHPSVVIWVPVNEPPMGEKRNLYDWIQNVVYPAIREADPTRPVLFAAEDSPDIQDIHCYQGYWDGAEGQFYDYVGRRAATRDPKRALMNTEYIEGMPPDRMFRWTGLDKKCPETDLCYAMFGMEQTEAMRRLGYDGILPYMFAGWTRGDWRPGYPTPMYAALSSALAPVAVSVDLFDRNYAAGTTLAADVWAMNDRNVREKAELRVYLCRKNPEFVPATVGEADAQLLKTISLSLDPGAKKTLKVKVPLPADESRLYLAAVLTPQHGKPAMSQREIRVLTPTATPETVSRRKYRVIGADKEALAWLKSRNVRFEVGVPYSKFEPDVDMLIVWEDAEIDGQTANLAGWISDYVLQGGKMLIMRHSRWNNVASIWHQFPRLEDGKPFLYDTKEDVDSSAFASPGAQDSPLFLGIPKDYLLRWNGRLGAICGESIDADFLPPAPGAEGEVLCISGGKLPIVARTPLGKGSVLVTQMLFKGRLSKESAHYDPVAERLLLNLLGL